MDDILEIMAFPWPELERTSPEPPKIPPIEEIFKRMIFLSPNFHKEHAALALFKDKLAAEDRAPKPPPRMRKPRTYNPQPVLVSPPATKIRPNYETAKPPATYPIQTKRGKRKRGGQSRAVYLERRKIQKRIDAIDVRILRINGELECS